MMLMAMLTTEAELIERGVVVARTGRATRRPNERYWRRRLPRRSPAPTGSRYRIVDKDGAGDRRSAPRRRGKADIAEQRRGNGERAERERRSAASRATAASLAVHAPNGWSIADQDHDQPDDDGGAKLRRWSATAANRDLC